MKAGKVMPVLFTFGVGTGTWKMLNKRADWEFPGSPVIRLCLSIAEDLGLISGPETDPASPATHGQKYINKHVDMG